jgi:hypothetical protein
VPRGEEWHYIDTAEAVEIMAHNAAAMMSNLLTVPRKRTSLTEVSYARSEPDARDVYAEAIAQWRHWAGDDD